MNGVSEEIFFKIVQPFLLKYFSIFNPLCTYKIDMQIVIVFSTKKLQEVIPKFILQNCSSCSCFGSTVLKISSIIRPAVWPNVFGWKSPLHHQIISPFLIPTRIFQKSPHFFKKIPIDMTHNFEKWPPWLFLLHFYATIFLAKFDILEKNF